MAVKKTLSDDKLDGKDHYKDDIGGEDNNSHDLMQIYHANKLHVIVLIFRRLAAENQKLFLFKTRRSKLL